MATFAIILKDCSSGPMILMGSQSNTPYYVGMMQKNVPYKHRCLRLPDRHATHQNSPTKSESNRRWRHKEEVAQGYGRIGCSAYTLPLPMSSRTRSTHTSMAAPHSSRIAASAGPRGSSHGSPPPAHRRDPPDPRAVTPRPLVPLLPARHAAALCAARRGPSRWRGGGGAPGRLWALGEGRDSDSVTW